MRVLLVHNHYQQPGGEDRVFAAEADLLESRGHRVLRFTAHNDSVAGGGSAALAATAVWNGRARRELSDLVRRERPDVAHFHNTFPLISPAAYYAARAEGVPVIQTLHNYRLVCPNALLFRDGGACEDCLGRALPWPGVVHACYRGSRAASGATAAVIAAHRMLGTWGRTVTSYVALTRFAREKLVQGGLPPEKVVVKPNFVDPDPGTGEGRGGYALFVGRLSPEKGLGTLLAAWRRMGDGAGGVPLRIVGGGPLEPWVAATAREVPGVSVLGERPAAEVRELMRDAAFLVFPSECYENLPTAIIESFAAGTPVLASDMGAAGELVDGGRTGLRFRPRDPDALAARVGWMLANPTGLRRMRREARAEFEKKYTADRSYEALTGIYRSAMRAGASHNPDRLSTP